MTSFLSLFSQIPSATALGLVPQSLQRSQVYSGTLENGVDQPVWLAELTPGAAVTPTSAPLGPDRFFLSGNGRDFHQLRVSTDHPSPTASERKLYLTLTPHLGGMALEWIGPTPRLVLNHPETPGRLVQSALRRANAGKILENAAFYLYSEGETPLLEGAVKLWWEHGTQEQAAPPADVPFDTMLHVARRLAHGVNNANSVILTNTSFALPSLAALSAFFERLAESEEVRTALDKALEAPGPLREAWEDTRDHSPVKGDPLRILAAMMLDFKDLTSDIEWGGIRTTRFMRSVGERIAEEVPAGITDVETIIRECEDEFRQARRSDDHPAGETLPDPATASPSGPVAKAATQSIADPILIVDDDADTSETTEQLLRLEGFSQVTRVHTTEKALEAIDALPNLRAILCDYNLAEAITGLDFVRRIRGRLPDVGIILYSGAVDELLEKMSVAERSSFEVVRKPYEASELTDSLLRVINTPSPK